MTTKQTVIGWDVPGWDWEPADFSWLSSKAGINKDGVWIFFIHGGRIRHQAHLPHGSYTVEEFIDWLHQRAAGLDGVRVNWMADTGGGDPDFWLEGTRPPNVEDVARLQSARDRQRRNDKNEFTRLKKLHPEWV